MNVPAWIVDAAHRQPAADRYHAGNRPDLIQPIEGVVYHYTGPGTSSGIRRWLTMDDENYVSATFVVDRSGDVWQLVPLDERAFHAGGATSRFLGHQNVNGRAHGIEILNVGPVQRGAGGRWEDSAGRPFDGALFDAGAIARGKSRFWEAYPAAQIEAVIGLTRQLCSLYPILGAEPESRLTGHEDVDPTRKTDPGPAFPWTLVRAAARGS